MSKIKAVLFDLDGVLVDGKEWHYESLNHALSLFGYNISRFEHLTTFDGLPTRKKLEHLSVTKQLPRRLHRVINRVKQNFTMGMIGVECFPQYNIEYAVSHLRKDGYKIAVCSNSIRQTMNLMLERSALINYFDLTLSNEDCKHPKPDPEIYQNAMAKFGLDPDSVLILEDNPHGLEAARRSGAHVLKVKAPSDISYSFIKNAIKRIEDAHVAVADAHGGECQAVS